MNNLRPINPDNAVLQARKNLSLDPGNPPTVGVILGTGWGGALGAPDSARTSLSTLPGFNGLPYIEGHARELVNLTIGNKQVIALSGRVHMNESPNDARIPQMVRLQVELLIKLGVKTLILTNAAGSLDENLKVGAVMIVENFLTLFAGTMPLWAGEFHAPNDMLVPDLVALSDRVAQAQKVEHIPGCLAMVRGPHFEGPADKRALQSLGAAAVGMSMLPEACIAALHKVPVLGLSFITNSAFEEHSHQTNLDQAKQQEQMLGNLLSEIIQELP